VFVFEEDFVVFWGCNYGIQCRIPGGWHVKHVMEIPCRVFILSNSCISFSRIANIKSSAKIVTKWGMFDDAGINDPIHRIRYIQYWETKIDDLESALKTVSAGNLQGFREDIDLYTEIRQLFSKVTDILRDLNSLTIKIHEETGFNGLFSAIQQKLSE
jgi:hypothetical protein